MIHVLSSSDLDTIEMVATILRFVGIELKFDPSSISVMALRVASSGSSYDISLLTNLFQAKVYLERDRNVLKEPILRVQAKVRVRGECISVGKIVSIEEIPSEVINAFKALGIRKSFYSPTEQGS